jgi:flagellar biosynthesis protein FlhF
MATTPTNQQLQIKSYFARSVQDAIEHARGEMGADALLLNSRPAPPEARYLGEYEVVFGSYPEQKTAVPPPAAVTAPLADMEDLRRQMDEIRNLLMRPSNTPEAARARQPDLVQALVRADVEVGVAASIEEAVMTRLNQRNVTEITRSRKTAEWDAETVRTETINEIASRIQIAPGTNRITALVGPPGVGKTTTLIKMAVNQAMATGRSVRLISADSHRIGAAEQFRTYANILGVPFQTVDNSAALAQALEASAGASHVFIDTPGLSPALIDELGMDTAAFLSRRQDIDTHLVLTATSRQLNLEKTAERFAIYGASRLIFTHLDETETLGPLFGATLRTGKPLSFFAGGQLIPEDLEPASTQRIAEGLVRHLPRSLRAAV